MPPRRSYFDLKPSGVLPQVFRYWQHRDQRLYANAMEARLKRLIRAGAIAVDPPLPKGWHLRAGDFAIEVPGDGFVLAGAWHYRILTAGRIFGSVQAWTPPPVQSKSPPSKRGRKPYDIWEPMFTHLDKIMNARGGPFPTYTIASQEGLEFLKLLAEQRRKEGKGTVMPTLQTIAEKISKLQPDLVIG